MVIPALLIALVAAALAIVVIATEAGDADGATVTTSPVVVPATVSAPAEPTVPPAMEPAVTGPATTTPATTTTLAASTTITAAPAENAPPPAPPAPPTTVATTTSPPAPPGRPSALVTAPEAEAFVRSYYDAVAGGNYELSWSQLAPEFQRGKARSYDYYVGFWNENDLDVGDIAMVEADQDSNLMMLLKFTSSMISNPSHPMCTSSTANYYNITNRAAAMLMAMFLTPGHTTSPTTSKSNYRHHCSLLATAARGHTGAERVVAGPATSTSSNHHHHYRATDAEIVITVAATWLPGHPQATSQQPPSRT